MAASGWSGRQAAGSLSCTWRSGTERAPAVPADAEQLRGCDLEDSYLIVLGAMLLSASSLRRLHLADNRITERGVSFILRWLQVPESKSRLEVLDMDGNRCQDPVVPLLAGCQHIPSLRSIFLRSNLVSDMATQQVHDMLKTRGFGQISILL
mmetsp:Transcript_10217/g.34083  ORF Transcript_10217/g.34083 Transcript_10217/m.34083 type:complete len:152 (+) Transcript_10217:1561-2016(+)